jgi:hypothetical protein
MNDLEKTPPLLAQEASEDAFQEQPAALQERFLVLDEEMSKGVIGGAGDVDASPSSSLAPSPSRPRFARTASGLTLVPPGAMLRTELRRTRSSPAVPNPCEALHERLGFRFG